MASNATAGYSLVDLFQRKATGLLRGWSVWDAFIYATFSINLITLGLFILSYAPFVPDGALIPAIILAGLYLIFQAVTYAALIAVMPRAGGDYVWMSRILGGGIGLVVYPLALGPHLRRHPDKRGLRPDGLDPGLRRVGDLLRVAGGHLHRLPDPGVPGLRPDLARDALIRPRPEVLLLRRPR